MKHLLPFRLFETQTTSVLTPDQEAFLNEYTRGAWSVNPETGLVDVSGSFYCSSSMLGKSQFTQLKSFQGVSFGQVSGNFLCANNRMTTLEGAPQTVNGNFYCAHNLLTTLEGAPQTVDGDFECGINDLTSLEGAPRTVDGDFNCKNNPLTSLEGSPQTVGGDFICPHNPLTSLEGAPQTIDGRFYCDAFQLDRDEWNFSGWEKILTTGNAAAQKLMKTLPWTQPDWWNSELQRDLGKTVHLLAPWWKDMPKNLKSKIVIPPGYEDELDLFSGFDELGLF